MPPLASYFRRVPICGFTADTTQATRERFQDVGGSDIIYEPWQPGQVEDVCNAMVAKTLSRGERRGRRELGLKAEREETIVGDLQGILNSHLLVVVVVGVVDVVFTFLTVPTHLLTFVMVQKYPRNVC